MIPEDKAAKRLRLKEKMRARKAQREAAKVAAPPHVEGLRNYDDLAAKVDPQLPADVTTQANVEAPAPVVEVVPRSPYTPITEESIGLVMWHLSHGTPLNSAVVAVGIDAEEFHRRLREGKRHPETSPHAQMSVDIRKAIAQVESRMVKTAVPKNGVPDAKWWLERRSPEFAPRLHVMLEAQQNVMLDALQEIVTAMVGQVVTQDLYMRVLQRIADTDQEMVLEGAAEEVRRLAGPG